MTDAVDEAVAAQSAWMEAQVGVVWFHVDVVGVPAHAAYATSGHNAIEAAHSILVEQAVARAAEHDQFLRVNAPRIRYDGFVCEGSTVPEDEPLVQGLSAAYEQVHGAPPALRPTTATTDARRFIRQGIPAVCFGPRAENYHGIDERVSVSSMHECAQVLARFIVDWSGGGHHQ